MILLVRSIIYPRTIFKFLTVLHHPKAFGYANPCTLNPHRTLMGTLKGTLMAPLKRNPNWAHGPLGYALNTSQARELRCRRQGARSIAATAVSSQAGVGLGFRCLGV